MDDYRDVNRANWDERVAAHAASPDYALARFSDDPAFLSEVVRFDRPRLGDIAGLDAVHLQCHIGTDTVSLARLGARMTGLDFSAPALEQGRRLAAASAPTSTFVESDLYGAPDALGGERFDLVYTGIGALCWLPDIAPLGRGRRRACCAPAAGSSSARATRCCGRSPTRCPDGLLVLEYPYFEQPEPMIWDEGGTYVQTDARLHAHVDARVEPRARRDRHGRARRGPRADGARGARLGAVGGLPGHMTTSAAASSGSPIGPSGCRTATRCRRASPPDRRSGRQAPRLAMSLRSPAWE